MTVDDFRDRLAKMQADSGLGDAAFAKVAGLKLMTYRNIMQRGGKGSGSQGPSLATVLTMITALGKDKVDWLLTGQEPAAAQASPAAGAAVKDPTVTALLSQAQAILESGQEAFIQALAQNIQAFHLGVEAVKKTTPKPSAEPGMFDPMTSVGCRQCGHRFKERASQLCRDGGEVICPSCGARINVDLQMFREHLKSQGIGTEELDKLFGLTGGRESARE